MFKKVTNLLLTIALTGWMGVANATLIFDFSLDSSHGKVNGVILGLLDIDITQDATSVIITDIGGNTVNIDFSVSTGTYFLDNLFDVRGGELVDMTFRTGEDASGGYIIMRWSSSSRRFHKFTLFHELYDDVGNIFREFTIAKRVTVPEPDSVILVLLGLAGLSFARYRKQS